MREAIKEVLREWRNDFKEYFREWILPSLILYAGWCIAYKLTELWGLVPQDPDSWGAIVFFILLLITPTIIMTVAAFLLFFTKEDRKVRKAASKEGLKWVRYHPYRLQPCRSTTFKAVMEDRSRVTGIVRSMGGGEYTFQIN